MQEAIALHGGKPVRDKFLVFGAPYITQQDIDEVVDSLKSGWIGTGPKVQKFEGMFKEYIGTKHAISLNSCTAGLDLSLKLMGVKPGDEVITTPVTFAATANVIVHQGATPIFADIDKKSWNIDPYEIEKKITKKTKAIIPVHLGGRPCEMDHIMEIAQKHNIPVIEDAAHAIEATYKNKKIGKIGRVACFSFYPTKNITTVEGGMMTTDDSELAENLAILRLHGVSKDAWKRYSAEGFTPYDVLLPGFKLNMTDVQAALGLHQFEKIDQYHKIREKHFKTYSEEFAHTPEIMTPVEESHYKHARHLYSFLVDVDKLKVTRNEFCAAIQAENVGCGIHFLALHLSTYYKNAFNFKRGDFPNAEFKSDRTLSIPLSPALTDEEVKDVVTTVKKVVTYYKK